MILVENKPKTKIKNKPIKLHLIPKLIITILAFFILSPANLTWARTFNPHDIISDQELLNADSLAQTAIQKFLERENSVLARYGQIINSQSKKASEIIWEISQKHKINPKFLLTTLEKEQGLIRKSQATEKALDWATGYGCYGGSCKEKYRGFYNQVEAAAETQEIYWQKAGQFSFQVGQEATTFDGYKVTPQNKATANLYIYTPYVGYAPELGINKNVGGNKLFWRVWHRYFSHQKYLDGQVIKNGEDYWLIKNNQKKLFLTPEIFLKDYQTSEAILVSAKDLAAYPDGPAINFSNKTLVKSADSGQIFLIEDGFKRPIIDQAALALLSDFQIAVTEEEIKSVTESQLSGYSLGSLISASSIYPQGKLFKDESGNIWQIKNNLRHEVNPLVWQSRFANLTPETITLNELEKYPIGEPLKLKDGTFVKNENKYYLISNSERMKIEDETIFDRVFGSDKKNNALNVSAALLEIHSAGETIDYIDDTIVEAIVSTPISNPAQNYTASFDSLAADGLILFNGQIQSLTIKFKNTGTNSWQRGEVWLKVTEKDKETNSFGVNEKINFSESSVGQNQLATFTFNLTAPVDKSGVLTQEFSLYYNQDGEPTKITSIGKFVIVKPGLAAQIIEHNFPIAVKNTWRPITVTMKIKNLSLEEWLSKKTALEIYNTDGSPSKFYDPNDWVRKNVAAVPVNKLKIKPAEFGEFKFTLNPRGLKRGTYTLNIQLKLLDKNKQVLLNGAEQWQLKIRVD